ncbi:MAG: glgA [Chlamydiales bacterium]|jgi:starch synthase|nr:glgA [Chlamydiales bacterium]
MNIIQIASECAPIAKVGGLSDVLLGLSRQLVRLGHQVEVILPKYDCIDYRMVQSLKKLQQFQFNCNQEELHVSVWQGKAEDLNITFLELHHPAKYFDRGAFYGCFDDTERFIFFCRAAMEYLHKQQIKTKQNYDVIHTHDWQTALIGLLYQEEYRHRGMQCNSIGFTIHNLEYQGACGADLFYKVGLDGFKYLSMDKLQDNAYPSNLNLLKGGIVYANFVTTVSPTYAKESLTSIGGRGLDLTLLYYSHKFSGILNGLDYVYWNPHIDRYLPVHYNGETEKGLCGKYEIQKRLKTRLGLDLDDSKHLMGCITRLVPQKGIDLIKRAIFRTLEQGGQFVLLGTSPDPEIQAQFESLKHELQGNRDVHLELKYNEELSHWIYAGCDSFIVPSLFEPCGLTQMIALRYGTVPIVRKTGGLADSVFDIEYSGKPFSLTNGFVFEHPDTNAIDWVVDRVLRLWKCDKKKWQQLVLQGIRSDFSWQQSAQSYLKLYQKYSTSNS